MRVGRVERYDWRKALTRPIVVPIMLKFNHLYLHYVCNIDIEYLLSFEFFQKFAKDSMINGVLPRVENLLDGVRVDVTQKTNNT